MEKHTAKHFVLQLGSLVSLYLSLSFLLVLIFGLINLLFPDATDSVWQVESAVSSMRIGIAMVVVFFPAYITLTRIVNKTRRQDPEGSYLGLTKWLIYLSLLVGGAVLLGDLVAVIMAFLEGEITSRFILKALAVLLVVGFAFRYYLLDARGYWLANEKKSIRYGIIASVVVFITLLYGFTHIETPAEAREQKLDATQVQDLQEIQRRIADYLRVNNELPPTLDILTESTGVAVPVSPEGRSYYQYEQTEKGFNLCAIFAQPSKGSSMNKYDMPVMVDDFRPLPIDNNSNEIIGKTPIIVNPNSWEHGAGNVCFERVIK